MEILNGKNTSRKKAALRSLFITLICLLNLGVIAFLARRQMQLDRYGRETAAKPGKVAVARLEKETGRVVVRRKGAPDYTSISEGEPLYSGDIIQTTEDAKATLLFGKKTSLSLLSSSLLLIQEPMGNRAGEGAVLQIEKGSLSIESNAGVEGIASLKTPKSKINLSVRVTEFFYPEEDKSGASASARGNKSPLTLGIGYLEYLQKRYAPERKGDNSPEMLKMSRAMAAAKEACSKGAAACADLQDFAWEAISRLRGYNTQKEGVALTASVSKGGTDKINVEKGKVKVESGARQFLVTEGENLELEAGKTVTRAAISEKAQEALAANAGENIKAEPEESPVKPVVLEQQEAPPVNKRQEDVYYARVESYYWQ